MGFLDLIKKGVVEEFTGTIATGDLFLSLLTAFIAAIFITFIYKKHIQVFLILSHLYYQLFY